MAEVLISQYRARSSDISAIAISFEFLFEAMADGDIPQEIAKTRTLKKPMVLHVSVAGQQIRNSIMPAHV